MSNKLCIKSHINALVSSIIKRKGLGKEACGISGNMNRFLLLIRIDSIERRRIKGTVEIQYCEESEEEETKA